MLLLRGYGCILSGLCAIVNITAKENDSKIQTAQEEIQCVVKIVRLQSFRK